LGGGSLRLTRQFFRDGGFSANVRQARLTGIAIWGSLQRPAPCSEPITHSAFPLHRCARTSFAFSPAIYYWFPKILDGIEAIFGAKCIFWTSDFSIPDPSSRCSSKAMAGMLRRQMAVGGNIHKWRTPEFQVGRALIDESHNWMSLAAVCPALAQIPVIINLVWASRTARNRVDNSVACDTL